MRRAVAVFYLAAASAWIVAIPATPWLSVHLHRERPGFLLSGAMYQFGSLICHQRADRSFHLEGVQLPVCARCSGLYAGAPLGAIAALLLARFRHRDLSARAARLALIAGAAPTGLFWIAERMGWLVVSNTARAVSALPLGFMVSMTIAAALVTPARNDRSAVSGVN